MAIESVTVRPIPGMSGYFATDDGRILGPDKSPIRLVPHSAGYLTVWAMKRKEYAHRLVARAFFGWCPSGHEVNHRNGIKSDNRPSNLEYVTHSENILHAREDLGRKCVALPGELHGMAKLKESDVIAIRSRCAAGESQTRVAKDYGIWQTTVSKIVRRERWAHV